MASTLVPTRPVTDRPTATRRAGYVLAIVVNGLMLWLAQQLLGWGWPGFLTVEFDDVLGLLSASFVASMVVNAGYLARDRGRFRALGELVVGAFGLVVSLRTWTVFPFDFAGYDHDWTWLFRLALVIAIVGTAVALVVNTVRLVRGPTDGVSGTQPSTGPQP